MKKIYCLIVGTIVLSFFSCRKDLQFEEPLVSTTENSVDGLGKKLENPYSIKNMKKAIQLLMSAVPEAGHPGAHNLLPTHLYVRFLPDNKRELDMLDGDSTLLYDPVPFGYENTTKLEYYHDPTIPKDKITWLYAFVPVNYTFPKLRYEILEEIYRPNDEYDELEVLALKLTGNLNAKVVDDKEIMSKDLSDKELLAIFSKRYNPKGTIHVENSYGGSVPLRRAAIYIKTLWWNDVTTTDDNGYYIVDRGYKDIPSVYIWNRNSTNYTTQRWTEHAGFWVSDKLGEGKEFNFTIRHDMGSKRDLWVKSTINNAYVIYDDFALNNGFIRPYEVKTWVFKNLTYGGAPMLHNQLLTAYSVYYPGIAIGNSENFGSVVGKSGILALSPILDEIIASTVKHSHLPDIVIGTNNQKTSEIYAKVFHELAHYSHKNKLNNSYWANVQYQAMYDGTSGLYGDGSPTYARHAGLAETWSHFVEYQLMELTGLSLRENYSTNVTAYNRDPATIPATSTQAAGSARWIPSGLLKDLMDADNNMIVLRSGRNYESIVGYGIDRVSGFTYKEIYDLLTSDVVSVAHLKTKIISQYSYKNTNNEITELFELYGY